MASGGSGEVYPTLWGFSPALDLQMHCRPITLQYLTTCEDIPELNILLVGCGDGRHLLKTVCQAHRWPHRKLRFFIIESDLELLARQMLFLTLALENLEQISLQEKCEMFLELFGNSLIRSKTATYLQEKCEIFIHCVTNPDYQQSILPQLNMSFIKAAVINATDYNRWREKGIAFMMREAIYDVSNKTLASHMTVTHRCGKVRARGYWGDITTSPYIAYGIETEEKSLLKTTNGVHTKTAQDLSKFNITSMFHELVTGQKYSAPALNKDEPEDNSVCNISANPVTEATIQEEETIEKTNRSTDREDFSQTQNFIKIDNVEVHFLPLSWLSELQSRSKFLNFFNLIYFSCSMIHYLNPEYKLITARKATLIVELTKFMVDLHVDKVKSYVTIVTKIAKEAGFTITENIDWKSDHIATFERVEDCPLPIRC
ncbi:dynein axonemal assembly factor 3 isoform 2-T2 [Mantella aurantiaca]